MAYNAATITQIDPPVADGRVHVVVAFTGNAGEPAMKRETYVDESTDLDEWARQETQRLNQRRVTAAKLSVGQVLDLAPKDEPMIEATAQDVWLEKVQRLARLKAMDLTNQEALAAVDALQADVDASYQQAYVDAI